MRISIRGYMLIVFLFGVWLWLFVVARAARHSPALLVSAMIVDAPCVTVAIAALWAMLRVQSVVIGLSWITAITVLFVTSNYGIASSFVPQPFLMTCLQVIAHAVVMVSSAYALRRCGYRLVARLTSDSPILRDAEADNRADQANDKRNGNQGRKLGCDQYRRTCSVL